MIVRRNFDRTIYEVQLASFSDGSSVYRRVTNDGREAIKFGLQKKGGANDHQVTFTIVRDDDFAGPGFRLKGAPMKPICDLDSRERSQLRFVLGALGDPPMAEDWGTWHELKLQEILSSPAERGKLVLPADEVELYQMLGEPIPFLWAEPLFLEWVAENEGRLNGW